MPITQSFAFFPSDYLGDPHTIVMNTEENGAYCLLMWVCWEQDGLPSDVSELADLARLPVKRFAPMWEKRLKRCFIFDEKRAQFLHPRFQKIIKEKKAFRKQKSKAGKMSGQKRRNRREQVFNSEKNDAIGAQEKNKNKKEKNENIFTQGTARNRHNLETHGINELSPEQTLDSVRVSFEQNTNKNEPSYSSSSSSSSSVKKEKKTTTTARAKPKPKPTDEEWLESLRTNPAYERIPVLQEFERAKVWADTNNRQCTRRFFIGWLNRARPMEVNTNGTTKTKIGPHADTRRTETTPEALKRIGATPSDD